VRVIATHPGPRTRDVNLLLRHERFEQPLRWRRPRMMFVNSMSDLFHELVPLDFIERVFEVMAKAEQQTF
jgi:protein gp37